MPSVAEKLPPAAPVLRQDPGDAFAGSSAMRQKVLAVVLLSGVLPFLLSLTAESVFGNLPRIQEPLHEGVELLGSFIALAVAMLLLLRAGHEERDLHLWWVTAALVAMGVMDGAHAVTPFGVTWSWMRHSATLLGGLFFSLVWIPVSGIPPRKRAGLIAGVALFTSAFALGLEQWSILLPAPFTPAGYSIWVKAANAIGGIGFMASAFFFLRRYVRRIQAEDLVFASHALLFGSSSLFFGFSHLWAADWWVWHAGRLLAYVIILTVGYETVSALYRRIAAHASELEEEVRNKTAELRGLAEIVRSSEDAIVGKSLDGIITSWNRGAEHLYGYTAAEAIGKSMLLVVPPERHAEVEGLLQRVAGGNPVSHHATVRMTKDGRRVDVSVSVSPVRDEKGTITGASAIVRDMTEQKRAEEAVRRLNVELDQRVHERTAALEATQGDFRRANEELVRRATQLEVANQELQAFTYSVSHDLRSPLRHISGYGHILTQDLGARMDPEVRRYVDKMQQGADQMGRLIDDLLAFSRLERAALRPTITGLASLVDEVIQDLHLELQGREVEWKIGELPFTECDPALMRQVLMNLLANAVKFTRTRRPAVIEVGHTLTEAGSTIFVRDNGVGFSMKYAAKLFGVFQRLHRAEDFEGTGVGLATVRRIILKHGGRVWAEAELDRGATFYFTLNSETKTELTEAIQEVSID